MESQPDISVIVPCYNAERYLSVCLESLKAQRQPEIQMILIDDGSTDATGEMLDRFARSDPRARVIHVKNGGVSSARNRGLALAGGRYIAFVDADDALEENALKRLYDFAEQTGAQIVSANHTLFDMDKGQRVPVQVPPVMQKPAEIAREIIHMHRIYNNVWNKLYDRALLADLRMDEGVRIGEDALFNLQLYLRAERVAHLPQYTYVYRVHSHSAMAGVRGYSEAHQPMLRGMNEILLELGKKEQYFKDFLQSCVWIDEKERGIRACMRTFDARVRPLVVSGVREEALSEVDAKLYRLVKGGRFPAFYTMMRVREKVIRRKWGIRR
ncbi:MAG: glycosyltransferase [Christensenellales bacterium]|nr:glycosyltransferase [Christensenellales bacterium]